MVPALMVLTVYGWAERQTMLHHAQEYTEYRIRVRGGAYICLSVIGNWEWVSSNHSFLANW